jgi:ketosteroid isomerase-like protein
VRRISSAAYVTAVLRFLQAYNAGDFDACAELLEPDIEWHGVVAYNGRDEVKGYLEGFHGRWERSHARPEDFREAGGRVLMVVAFTGEGAHGQPSLDERQSWICELTENGTIRRVLTYATPGDAAKALERLPEHVAG